jgi:hypothetical protein
MPDPSDIPRRRGRLVLDVTQARVPQLIGVLGYGWG